MKKLFSALAIALLGLCAFADIDTVTIANGESVQVSFPAKVARIEVLSSVASGTASLKSEKLLLGSETRTVGTVYTNFTYVSISTNDFGICSTNVTSFDQAPFLPPAPFLQSYVTNTTTRTITLTNDVPVVVGTVTNTVGSTLTCTNGFTAASPENCYLVPGDRVFFIGTATGKVTLILEK